MTEGVDELSDMLLVQLREIRANLEKTLSWDTDWLQKELDEFYTQKLPELEELKRNLKTALESDHVGYDLHPKKEAEREKLSKEKEELVTEGLIEEFHETAEKKEDQTMFAYVLAMLLWIMLLWIKQTTQAVVKDGGKQQLLLQGEVDVEKPDLEKEASNQDATVKDDIDKHMEEVDADEAPTVENLQNLVPTKKGKIAINSI